MLDLYSQQPSRTDSPQGLNSATAVAVKTLPTSLPSATPSKPGSGRGGGFDQRLDAMQPKVEVSASAGYVNYAMGVANSVPVPANLSVVPPIGVPHAMPPVGFSFPGYAMIPPTGQNPPIPPTTPQGYAAPPPLPPTQASAFYAQYPAYAGQVFPPTPPTAPQPPPPPRPY